MPEQGEAEFSAHRDWTATQFSSSPATVRHEINPHLRSSCFPPNSKIGVEPDEAHFVTQRAG